MNTLSNAPDRPFLAYADVLRRGALWSQRESEIPVDHGVSLGLPTCRWSNPGYAFFASPALRRPGLPVEQEPPDRWWVLEARTGRLIIYALSTAVSFSSGAAWGSVTLPATSRSLQDAIAEQARVGEFFDRLAPAFFQGRTADPSWRQGLSAALSHLIPEPLRAQYEALAPDFFAWLKA